MANFFYNEAKRRILAGEIDLDADDIRVALVRTGSDAATLTSASLMSDFVTLNEYDGTGYSPAGAATYALANKLVTTDLPNNRGEFDADDFTFTGLGAGSTDAQGALLYVWQGTFALSWPLAYFDTNGFPTNGNGGNLTLVWNAEGIIQAT